MIMDKHEDMHTIHSFHYTLTNYNNTVSSLLSVCAHMYVNTRLFIGCQFHPHQPYDTCKVVGDCQPLIQAHSHLQVVYRHNISSAFH